MNFLDWTEINSSFADMKVVFIDMILAHGIQTLLWLTCCYTGFFLYRRPVRWTVKLDLALQPYHSLIILFSQPYQQTASKWEKCGPFRTRAVHFYLAWGLHKIDSSHQPIKKKNSHVHFLYQSSSVSAIAEYYMAAVWLYCFIKNYGSEQQGAIKSETMK